MKFNYENEDLTAEVMQDLAEFGANLKVIAIYSVFPEAPDTEFITDYLWDEPEQSDFESEEEYESAMDDYLESLKTLNERKYKRMTVYELAQILKEQAEIF